jgi:microcystin-dependent protein
MEPLIGEIQLFAGTFAPIGWLKCEGQLISIAEYTALFSLLGTTYGGDGQTTFALPDLRSRVPIGSGNNYVMGQVSGSETVTMTSQNLPPHTHKVTAKLKVSANQADKADPTGNYLATVVTAANQPDNEYTTSAQAGITMNPQATTMTMGGTGGNQPINNMQPFQALTFIIAMEGIYPSRP